MRKGVIFCVLFLSSISAMAQDFGQKPRWCYQLFDHNYEGLSTDDEYWIEDNLIEKNGKKYARMTMWRFCLFDVLPTTNDFFAPKANNKKYVSIRSENDKILVDKEEYMALFDYFWQNTGDKDFIPYETNDDGELILYDFSKQAGDEYCTLQDGTSVTVTHVDTIVNSDGTRQRKLSLSNGMKLVEGVGCINSAGTFLFYLNPSPKSLAGFSYLYKVEGDDGNYLYYGDPFEMIEDQKAFHTNLTNIEHPKSGPSTSGVVYNLQGQRIMTTGRKGVYIQGGKKFIVR